MASTKAAALSAQLCFQNIRLCDYILKSLKLNDLYFERCINEIHLASAKIGFIYLIVSVYKPASKWLKEISIMLLSPAVAEGKRLASEKLNKLKNVLGIKGKGDSIRKVCLVHNLLS